MAETQARSPDNRANPWLADFKRAGTLIPGLLLPENQTTPGVFPGVQVT